MVGVVVVATAIAARRAPRATVVVTAIAALAIAYPVAHHYDVRRYAGDPVATWADSVHRASIAIAGFNLQFGLFGRDVSNRVQYIGRRGPHGAFHESPSCTEWRRALRDGKYDYVVVSSQLGDAGAHEVAWTASDPAPLPHPARFVASACSK